MCASLCPTQAEGLFTEKGSLRVRVEVHDRKLLLWTQMCKGKHFSVCEINQSNIDGMDSNQINYGRAEETGLMNLKWEYESDSLVISPASERSFSPS